MDTRAYWARVRQIEATLPEVVDLVSVDNRERQIRAGVFTQCDRFAAAKRIEAGTHRLATPAEVEAARENQRLVGGAASAEERLRRGVLSFELPASTPAKGKR
jgi:hypothetical protein